MRTRNGDATKSVTPKRTPPERKCAAKTAPDPAAESATPKTAETKRGAAARAKQAKNNESTPSPIISSDSKPEQSIDEETKASNDATLVTPEAKVAPRKKRVVRKVVKVVRKTSGKTKASTAKVVSCQTSKTNESVRDQDEKSAKEEILDAKDSDATKNHECATENIGESPKKEESIDEVGEPVENVAESIAKGKAIMELEESVTEAAEENQSIAQMVGEPENKEQTAVVVDFPSNGIDEVPKNEEPSGTGKEEEVKEVTTQKINDKEENKIEAIDTEENIKGELHVEDTQPVQDEYGGDEGYEEYGDRVDFEDHGEDDFVEDDPEEPVEEAEALEEERKELTAVAKERKLKKEYEIFVGGLDREATEDDVRKVFEKIGEVVEVRLHGNLSMNKSKGYAFVKFANKEHAKRALSEMKNPVICGKRCGTAPSEDNDTLFLGNICNTWTKEAIKQKLKDYGVEGVENITLVPDVQHEGRSRGFAFLEFSCHADAMHAYKRLQKPDVIFGHPERTAKVAFAEPIREPDPEIMAHVKTVFLDGLPFYWDEDRVREHLQGYGEIVRIVLARNMSTAKRKDFGFVDFSSHEAAVACIERINNKELGDGNSKTKVKARLSNPMPKTQAVKGGMCGGFLIDRAGNGTSSRFGRNFGLGVHHFNWANFQRDRDFYQRGPGYSTRMASNEYDFNNRHSVFRGRQFFGRGGRRGPLRGGYHPAGRGVAAAGPSRYNFNRSWFDASERAHGDQASSRRQPFSPEQAFDRPYVGRHFDDPYFYDDSAHGMKRPFFMTDRDDYAQPSRLRPRLDYNDPAVSFQGTHYHDTYEGRNDPYSHGYYGPEVSYQSLAFLIQFQLLAVLSNFVFVHIAVWCISTLLQEWSSIWRWLLLLGALRFG
ncbi:nucleolin isoform X2 [Manihot esculenta]|uniref:nucleolin isoform X2 n=1 Tax=Manihot esculenta TaxID=3983 RepID=UPI000B5D7814|nr:nucleolin isoform X2 [Manihot esculenta]